MKRLFLVLLVWAVFIQLSSCEKDDICVEGDTPLLVIGFYDINDTTFKRVNGLRIRSVDNEGILNNSADYGFADRGTSADSIRIPLRTTDGSTTFQFVSESSTNEDGNEIGIIDELQFNYAVRENFVSRACGFVANYDDLEIVRDSTPEDWILGINIIDSTITLSNRIHVQIFH